MYRQMCRKWMCLECLWNPLTGFSVFFLTLFARCNGLSLVGRSVCVNDADVSDGPSDEVEEKDSKKIKKSLFFCMNIIWCICNHFSTGHFSICDYLSVRPSVSLLPSLRMNKQFRQCVPIYQKLFLSKQTKSVGINMNRSIFIKGVEGGRSRMKHFVRNRSCIWLSCFMKFATFSTNGPNKASD